MNTISTAAQTSKMPLQFYASYKKIRHFIYLDTNVFRLLKRDPLFWNNFFDYFEREYPGLFKDIRFIFTWSQLFEDCDMGSVLGKNITLWQQHAVGKGIFQAEGINSPVDALERHFKMLCDIAASLPELQQASLLAKIDRALSFAHPEAKILCEETFIRARALIESNHYMEDLSYKIAWAFLCSEPFIESCTPWIQQQEYLDTLIALWHKVYLDGYDLDLYRLLDKRYHAYITYSGALVAQQTFEHSPLKPKSDLCDSQMIHYATFGISAGRPRTQCRVIGITFDESEAIAPRISISKQSLIDLNRDVAGWSIHPTPGEIISLTVDKKTKQILDATRTCFDTPFNSKEPEIFNPA